LCMPQDKFKDVAWRRRWCCHTTQLLKEVSNGHYISISM
jgi:hypothetical protein